ncbi:MAG TPA: hypothetical protein VIV59_07975 [Anaeromyxobacteraceae bacterium]
MKPLAILVLSAALTACGGTDKSAPYMWGGTVTVTAGAVSTTCVSTVTVTYSAAGVNPPSVSVPVGSCVDFVNADLVAHWPESSPHPTHTQCPWLNMTVAIPAWTGTGPMPHTTVGPAPGPPMACGFHDHLHPPAVGGGGGY